MLIEFHGPKLINIKVMHCSYFVNKSLSKENGKWRGKKK